MNILAAQKDDHVDGRDGEGHRAPSNAQEERVGIVAPPKGKPCLTFTP